MKKPISPLDQAIQSQLSIMKHFLYTMAATINDAEDYIAQRNRNAAIGALLECDSGFKNLQALSHAIQVMHQNANLIERNPE